MIDNYVRKGGTYLVLVYSVVNWVHLSCIFQLKLSCIDHDGTFNSV